MLCCSPALMKSLDSDVSAAASQETITRLLYPPHRSISELKSRRVWPAGFIYESLSSKAADRLEPQRQVAVDGLFGLCVRFRWKTPVRALIEILPKRAQQERSGSTQYSASKLELVWRLDKIIYLMSNASLNYNKVSTTITSSRVFAANKLISVQHHKDVQKLKSSIVADECKISVCLHCIYSTLCYQGIYQQFLRLKLFDLQNIHKETSCHSAEKYGSLCSPWN